MVRYLHMTCLCIMQARDYSEQFSLQDRQGTCIHTLTPPGAVVDTPHSKMTAEYHWLHSQEHLCQTEAPRERNTHLGVCRAVLKKLMLRLQLHLALNLRLLFLLSCCHESLPGRLASRLSSGATLCIPVIPNPQDLLPPSPVGENVPQ